jgi:hypothetical protein
VVAALLLWSQSTVRAQPAPAREPPAVEMPEHDALYDLSEIFSANPDGVSLTILLDELIDELAEQMAKQDVRAMSPLAVRWVKLSPNLRADLALSTETRLQARLAKISAIEQVVCTDCRSLRSRIEGQDWVVSLGVVRQDDLRKLAKEIGTKVFLDIDVQYMPGPPGPRLVLAARVFRAEDARLLFATSIRAQETAGAILRTGRKPKTREEQQAEIELSLARKARFGHLLSIGAASMPYESPSGSIVGTTIGYRVQEHFGQAVRFGFGLQLEGFLHPDRLQTATISAVLSWRVSEPSLNYGELVLGAAMGGMVIERGTLVTEAFLDYLMKFRMSLGVGVFYVVPVRYGDYDFGGASLKGRLAVNW